jgi:hypothetical protein
MLEYRRKSSGLLERRLTEPTVTIHVIDDVLVRHLDFRSAAIFPDVLVDMLHPLLKVFFEAVRVARQCGLEAFSTEPTEELRRICFP